jgi:hypothetical protein
MPWNRMRYVVSLTSRVPALCMLISGMSLMLFPGLVAYRGGARHQFPDWTDYVAADPRARCALVCDEGCVDVLGYIYVRGM